MVVSDKIKEQLGNWWPLWVPFIESEEFDKVSAFLKQQSQLKKVIIPKAPDLFKSFELVDRHKMRALVILMDPYPSFKEDKMIANGVPMSCAATGVLQPSLQLWYEAIEQVYC